MEVKKLILAYIPNKNAEFYENLQALPALILLHRLASVS